MNKLSIQENDTMESKDNGTQSTKWAFSCVGKLNFIFMIYDLPNTPIYPEFESHTDAATR